MISFCVSIESNTMVKRKSTIMSQAKKLLTQGKGGNMFTDSIQNMAAFPNRMKTKDSGAGRKRKHKRAHKKRGGVVIPFLGIDIAETIANAIASNSFVNEHKGTVQENVPEFLYPSKLIREFDLASKAPDGPTGFKEVPRDIARELQKGIADGLDQAGIGRPRRRGRPSLQSKRARARHVSAKKRHAKFAHKKVNKKRHSKK